MINLIQMVTTISSRKLRTECQMANVVFHTVKDGMNIIETMEYTGFNKGKIEMRYGF